MQAEQQREQEALSVEVLADLLTLHGRATKGVWAQGTSSHHTVSKREGQEDYHIANFHHADDASFVDVAHKYMPLLIDALHAARAALSHPSTPQEWKLVPVKLKQDMANAAKFVDGRLSVWKYSDAWDAMLAASPPPPEQGSKG